MTRLYGRAPRGQRLIGRVPYGHWQTTTFIAGLRHDGIVAPMVLDGPINGPAFRAYVEHFLAPTLTPANIVIAGNLSSHKGAEARAAIEARGATLMFVPPYSPDQNPIEQAIAKLKSLVARWLHARKRPYTNVSETALAHSNLKNAQTTSLTPATYSQHENALNRRQKTFVRLWRIR